MPRETWADRPTHYYTFVDSTDEVHVVTSKRPGLLCATVAHLPASGILKPRKEIALSVRRHGEAAWAHRIRQNGHKVDVLPIREITAEEAQQLKR